MPATSVQFSGLWHEILPGLRLHCHWHMKDPNRVWINRWSGLSPNCQLPLQSLQKAPIWLLHSQRHSTLQYMCLSWVDTLRSAALAWFDGRPGDVLTAQVGFIDQVAQHGLNYLPLGHAQSLALFAWDSRPNPLFQLASPHQSCSIDK